MRKLDIIWQMPNPKERPCFLLLEAPRQPRKVDCRVAAKFGLKCAIIAIDPYPGKSPPICFWIESWVRKFSWLLPTLKLLYEEQLNQTVSQIQKQYEGKGESTYFIPWVDPEKWAFPAITIVRWSWQHRHLHWGCRLPNCLSRWGVGERTGSF